MTVVWEVTYYTTAPGGRKKRFHDVVEANTFAKEHTDRQGDPPAAFMLYPSARVTFRLIDEG